ncbi:MULTISPECIES: RES family NAD+ phosphorylase [Serratia]|uniref:RES family NAD+ phosphorylase n=1 Tax=Serratia TaxID=613 RepID=UPI0006603FB0|nr:MULTISPECIES: RES family NAD+ phosphorylase [Serratia]
MDARATTAIRAHSAAGSSGTASLALLETRIHLHAAQTLECFTLLRIDVPDNQMQSADMNELPDHWADEDAPPALVVYGDAWWFSKDSIALRVPNTLSPVEYNYLLNTEHPDFYGIIQKAETISFPFDMRAGIQELGHCSIF